MNSRIGIFVGLLLVAGCQAPWIQVPSLVPGNPAAERASYTLHDPMPDSSLGPNVSGRPRESLVQRSEPRRTMEAAIPAMTNQQPPGVGGQPLPQPLPGSYPDSVSP